MPVMADGENISLDLKPDTPLYKRVLEAINRRYRLSSDRMSRLQKQWMLNEDQFIAWLPERSIDEARRYQRYQGGKPQYTTVVLPYTYAMLMSAHSYWTTVFLSRDPIFQYSGRHGESVQQTQALEALIAYQVQVGRMLVPLYFWLLDCGKYGIGIMANWWDEEVSPITRYQEVPEVDPYMLTPTGRMIKKKTTELVRGYSGNRLINIRPYDYFPDPRVPLWDVQRGEFCGYFTEVTLNQLKRGEQQGRYINIDYLRTQQKGGVSTGRVGGSPRYEMPNDPNFSLNYMDMIQTGPYGIVTMYVELIPQEWGLGKGTFPEKWAFTASTVASSTSMVGSSNVSLGALIGAMPLGSYHNKFPLHVMEMEPEAYAFASRGMPQIVEPIQRTMDWLLNTHMYNVRKVLNDQFVIDPSRIVMKDFKDPQPGGGIRLKPAAYGTDVREALQQLQVQDVTAAHLRDMQFMDLFGQKTSGVNDQLMGQVDTGGRKTAVEVRSSSTFGVNRMKTIAEMQSAMAFSTLAEMLVANSQQNYDQELKLKIVGDLMLEAGQQFVDVSPEDIYGFFDFVPVDGTMPIDRYAQANLWKELIQGLQQMPQLAAQYDLGRIFAWVAQLAGLKNINKFKIQVAPPGQMPSNVIPMPQAGGPAQVAGGAPPQGRQDMGRTIEPGQIPGLGTTG